MSMTTITKNSTNEKTVLRKRLEEIHEEVYRSWLKDVDRVTQLLDLTSFLEQILTKTTIEENFESQGDLEYFMKNFTAETITNILRQTIVYGPNGDEVALNVMFLYLKIFVQFMDKPQYSPLWESMRDIFDYTKSYYKGSSYSASRNLNEKKTITAEQYNETHLKRKSESKIQVEKGMEIDIMVYNSRQTSANNPEKRVWIRGRVSELKDDHFVAYTCEDSYPLFLKYNSFEFAPAGTMTKDWEWRLNLKQLDNVDGYDRQKWFPSTIVIRKEDTINGMKKVEYRVSFKLYTQLVPNWEEYRHFWPEKDLTKDSQGKEYIGDIDNFDEWLPFYSKRIQKFNSMIMCDQNKVDTFENENYFIDDMVRFTDEDGSKCYVVGRNSNFSYYYATLLAYFAEMKGFDMIISCLSNKGDKRPSPDLVNFIFHVLNTTSFFFHKEYVIELGKVLHENIFNYLNEMNQNELRNIKKETLELITKVLRFYLGLTIGTEKRNEIIERFSISFAIKMIKTSFLDKRIAAVKTIIDVIKSSRQSPEKRDLVLKLVEENQVFNEIYGPNSHVQLMNKSKDLLEIILQENKLSDTEVEMIWNGTKKGDLEGKLTILKTLKEISKFLRPSHIKVLLENIYSSKGSDLLNDEIDLIYELSTLSGVHENIERCIKFFTQCLLDSNTDEGERIDILINKIINVTKLYPHFKSSVLNMTLQCLEMNDNVILALKIIEKYVKESLTDFDVTQLLKQVDLVDLFRTNFTQYIKYVKEKAKNWGQDIDQLPLRDHFTHSQNIKARLNFMNVLIEFKLFADDAVEFIYKILIEDGSLSEKDEQLFYTWIKNVIEVIVDYETQEKIFKLFNEKICKDSKACVNLSIEAFDTYLKVFLDINMRNNNLRYNKQNRDAPLDLEVYVEPEKLIGFGILWKIIFESFSSEIMNKGIEILHTLFGSVLLQTDSTTDQSYTQLLIKKCINLIKSTIEDAEQTNQGKKNVITKCLLILRLIVEESEKRGTAGVISHEGLLKRKIINFKIFSTVGVVRSFPVKLYGNTTMWDLKRLITLKLKYHCDFLKIGVPMENSKEPYEVRITDNGKTLIDMGIDNGCEVRVYPNGIEKSIQNVELEREGKLVQELVEVFNDWFNEYSTDEKMTKEECAKFVKRVTGGKEEITVDDQRITDLYRDRDKNKDGLLERDEFVQFYIDAAKPERRRLIWENLRCMGIRNDLKKISEPFFYCNEDKLNLPRYQLTNNEEFFNVIFYLQDLNEDIAKEAFHFLCFISTNPRIYNQILQVDEQTEWNVLISDTNIYKLIYSLQIIESFIEDVEINSSNVDNLILSDSDDAHNMDKTEWMKNFVERGGFKHLVNILGEKLKVFVDSFKEDKANSMMNNICIGFLLKIVKIFYVTSLVKFDSYKRAINEINKSNEDVNQLQKESSFKANQLEDCFAESGLSERIITSINHNTLIVNFLSVLQQLIHKSKTNEEKGIVNTSFEFLTVLIPHSPEFELIEKTLQENKTFVDIAMYGLLHADPDVRLLFSRSLIKLCKLLQHSNQFGLIVFLFKNIFTLIDNLPREFEQNSNQLFEFFSYLLEMYIAAPEVFATAKINSDSFLKRILDSVCADINDEGKSSLLSNELFLGYLRIISKCAENNKELKQHISNDYNLIQGILTKVLFKQTSESIIERLADVEYVDPDKINDGKTSRNADPEIRKICYTFILSMLKDSIENFEKFFSVNVLDSDREKEEEKKKESRYFQTSYYGRNEGHVGLRNLGCICYMNASLQQFFMVPSLRYALLAVSDGIQPDVANSCGVDDNILHQIQRMFSFLEMSERMDYNPFGFCFSFKDFDGRPVNLSEQKDAQEFLSIFFERIENKTKSTSGKYTMQNIFGGKTCSQIVCQNCGYTSNRFEDFVNLSVEVRNMKTLSDSLDKLISFENIDEYGCDGCKKKVSITKRNSLANLPNVLIVHLQRISYNWEIDRNEKINSRLEFPRTLNLKQYCMEEIMRKSAAEKAKDDDTEINVETDEIYFKQNSYYEYYLVGVVVHIGSADSGHYYSYINTVRGGEDNESYYNPTDESHANSWLEYNDSYISKFNVAKLEDDCFGGSFDNAGDKQGWSSWGKAEKSKSAYMLVYERKVKTPMKIVVQPQSENLVSFKAEEAFKTMKENDLLRYFGKPEFNQMQEKVFSTVFFDVNQNEYFKFTPFYHNQRLIPKNYYLEIMNDNSNFQKHQNISDERFANFFDHVINLLDETIRNLSLISKETALKISTTFMNFILNILSKKDKQQLLKQAKDKFIHIVHAQPSCLVPVWNYISNNLKQISDVLLNENETICTVNAEMLTELIEMLYKSSPEKFVQASMENEYDDENTYSQCIKTIDFIISHFPRVAAKYLTKTGPIMKMLRHISLIDDSIVRYLVSREIAFVFITYLIGRDSPCYSDTLVKQNENWDYGMRQFVTGSEPMVELIYDIFTTKRNIPLDLSTRDEKCIKCPAFLKHVFKANTKIFAELLVSLNKDDYDFTIQSCGEITHSIDEINYYSDSVELVKLTESILPLLKLKDSYQRMRFEILLGLPQITIDDSLKHPFPLMGYHNLTDKKGKYMSHKSTSNVRFSCSLIKKLFEFNNRSTASVKVFLLLLEECSENDELLKYIRRTPADEPRLSDFIEWGVVLVNEYGKNDDNPYKVQLKSIVKDKLNSKLGPVLADPTVIPGFNGFCGKYLIKDIKREEITMLIQKDNLYLMMVEYFANTVTIDDNIDFSSSKSFIPGNANIFSEDKQEEQQLYDESENLKDVPEDSVLLSSDMKVNMSEREFYRHILVHFTTHNKVIVQNKNSVPGFRSIAKRFIIFNSKAKYLI